MPCRVEQAARAGAAGNEKEAEAACKLLEEGPWRQECNFRAGEELGGSGHIEAGLKHCQNAGRFRTFCLTHLAWHIPAEAPGTVEDWVRLAANFPAKQENAEKHLRARWWFNRYYGTGEADPAPARSASEVDGPYARGAWALEAVRLTEGQIPLVEAAWKGHSLKGPALPPEKRVGHYDPPIPIDGEVELPHIPTFGGSSRLVGETPEEDLQVAILEALYFREGMKGDVFEPYLGMGEDGKPYPKAVRYTAFRLFRILPSAHPETTLQGFAGDPDRVVQEHVADALKYRTWEGKKQGK